MQLLKSLTVFLFAFLIACTGNNNTPETTAGGKSTSQTATKNNNSNNSKPANTITGFLKWYKVNMDRLGKIPMVNNSFSEDSTKLYSVNFEATEKYLAELKKSGFISDAYVTSSRDYFKKCDEHFSETHQYNGPPDGFDFDLIMWSQEYDYELANIDKTKVISQSIHDNHATVKLEFPGGARLIYELSGKEDKWLIDKIENGSILK